MPGPVPKRESELARPRSRKGGDQQAVTLGERRPVTVPSADPEWHFIARELFDSVKRSGQADFYQDSDWWVLYSTCEDLSRYKEPSINRETGEAYYKRSGQMLQTIMTTLERLLVTEGDRRRVRIELASPVEVKPDLKVVAMDDYRGIADG